MRIINAAFFLLLLFCSCSKTSDFYDELGQGSYLTFVSSNTFLNASDPDAEINLVVDKHGRDVESINVYVAASPTLDKTKWKLLKNVPFSGETTLKVTNQEIATALGLTPGVLAAGSVFNLYNELKTTDGQTFSSINTSAADLENQLAFNAAFQWAGTVTCSYDAATVAGTYTVVRDDWEDWVPGEEVEVTAGPGANQIDLGAVWPNPLFGNVVNPLVLNVDPATGAVTIPNDLTFGDYGGAKVSTTVGSNGLVFSCLNKIDVTVSINGFGLRRLVLQK